MPKTTWLLLPHVYKIVCTFLKKELGEKKTAEKFLKTIKLMHQIFI